jgi:hypothetical protein
MFLKFC